MDLPLLPTINAALNASATCLLICGWRAIKSGNKQSHKKWMIYAMIASSLFLTFYILNRIIVGGLTHYQGHGLMRGIYFLILGTHTPLAMIILPFSIRALWHAYHGDFVRHTRITRWLLPVWLYVSVTGVVIYVMLYLMK